jgi:putative inorganic carbon (HCO3(-)) transporter
MMEKFALAGRASDPDRRRSRPVAELVGSPAAVQAAIAVAAGLTLGAFTTATAAGTLPPTLSVLILAAVVAAAVAAMIGNVERLLLAVVVIDISFPIDKHLAYREDIAGLGTLGGLSLSVTTIAIAMLYGLWIAEALAGRGEQNRRRLTISVPLALYLTFVAVAATGARDTALASFELMLLVQTFLVFVYVANRIRTRSDVQFMVTLLVAGLALQAFMTLWLRYTGQDLRIGALSGRVDVSSGAGGDETYRLGGTVGSPNTAAAYFTLLIAPALALLLTDVRRRYKQLAFLAFPLGAVAVILTLSRGGWVALVVSLTIFCTIAVRRRWLPLPYLLLLGGIFLLVLLPFHDLIIDRISGADKGSAQSRFPLMHLAWDIIRDHPLTGVGTNNFASVLGEYVTPEFSRAWIYTVHNKYLLVWAELGLGGLLAFVWFLGETLRKGWACVRSADPLLAPIGLGFTAAIVGQMAHMFFDVFHSRPQVQSLWIVAALVAAVHRIVTNEAAVAQSSSREAFRSPASFDARQPGHPAPGSGRA